MSIRLIVATVFIFSLTACQEEAPVIEIESVSIDPEQAAQLSEDIKSKVSAKVIDGLDLSLWAFDSLVTAPIALSIDERGDIYYTSANRQNNSEFDIRGYREWMTQSISWQHVEDKRKFLRETFAPENSDQNDFLPDLNEDGIIDWTDLTVEKERVWRVMDTNNDGIADRSEKYLEDFHTEITDVANGVLVHEDDVFVAVGPDLWRTKDENKDGMADYTESISHGYAIHIGFGAHGMSGLRVGPYGRVWWGIGDIGMNVIDKDGKNWKYPNQGVIVRSELDGSGFEVFAAGLRNTHEFVFDKYGNLITEDNDGDHPGERERLVYVTNGSDGGWRTNWQFGKYTDPDNNLYKVWMNEKLHIPRWEGQAAHITPPIMNYVNGPTGMVYNPGTALGEEWYDHFFIAEFRGNPANSPIHAFKLKPNGASFEMDTTKEVVSGMLPTGIGFGPEGALYFADWITGWEPQNNARIWKLDVPGGENTDIRQETKSYIQADFTTKSNEELLSLLAHQDMRVRMKSQFALAKRGDDGFDTFEKAIKVDNDQMGRVHGIWGITQMSRQNIDYAKALVPLLADDDLEIEAQAAKGLGDVRFQHAGSLLIQLLEHPHDRVRFFAAEALGRIADKNAVQPIIQMLRENDDKDAWLRHAGIMALVRIGDEGALVELANSDSRALKIAGVVGLRKMKSAEIALFLEDADEFIATEAARGINDDFSIEDAIPALANTLNKVSFTGEPFIRRAINANLRVGGDSNYQALIDYANNTSSPTNMRAEAIATLGTWTKPSVLDRVDGRYRGEITRDGAGVISAFMSVADQLVNDKEIQIVAETAETIGRLGIKDAGKLLEDIVRSDRSYRVKLPALSALEKLAYPQIGEVIGVALEDKSSSVRSAALSMISATDVAPERAVALLKGVLQDGSIKEKQVALRSLGEVKNESAIAVLLSQTAEFVAGDLPPELYLDLQQAVESAGNDELSTQFKDQLNVVFTGKNSEYQTALFGGDRKKGSEIFFRHEGAQCMRCHTIWEWGGDAGPNLAGVGQRLSREQLLESLIDPTATIVPGFGVVSIETNTGKEISGVLTGETDEILTIQLGDKTEVGVLVANITERIDGISSMPTVKGVLSTQELRDLVEYLTHLKGGDPSDD